MQLFVKVKIIKSIVKYIKKILNKEYSLKEMLFIKIPVFDDKNIPINETKTDISVILIIGFICSITIL